MKTIKLVLTILTLTTFECVRGQSNLGQIPFKVKQTADSVILLTIGSDYFKVTTFECDKSLIHVIDPDNLVFNKCETPDRTNKKRNKKIKNKDLNPDFYILRYRLTLKENSTYGFEIEIDRNLKLKEKINLPDCINSNSCDIRVDSLTAIDIAIKSGLEKGLGINSKLIYDPEFKAFQWELQNHLKTKPDRGNTIYIDTQTGQRISSKDSQWVRHVIR